MWYLKKKTNTQSHRKRRMMVARGCRERGGWGSRWGNVGQRVQSFQLPVSSKELEYSRVTTVTQYYTGNLMRIHLKHS